MGIYVYALNTKVREISGETVGVAEFRFKDGSDYQECYNRYCKRRVDYFKNNPRKLPTLMTFSSAEKPNTMVEGYPVYLTISASFLDIGERVKVGTMKKVGRSWAIHFEPGAGVIIATHKQKEEERINDCY